MEGWRERVRRALEAVAAGRMVVIADDEERENEGDLVIAAEHVTPQAINFMLHHARGIICVPLTGERLDVLDLPLMVAAAVDDETARFTVTVDARNGIGSGVSARDRAVTIRTLIDPATEPADLLRPGHVFPLRARPGGVLERRGQTEASVDLMRLATLYPAAVICEIMCADGTMARWPDLLRFGRRHEIPLLTVEDISRCRLSQLGVSVTEARRQAGG